MMTFGLFINSCTFTLAPANSQSATVFPIGVWMQNPTQLRDNKFIVYAYKDMGINTFVGIWNWPSTEGMYPQWPEVTARALKNSGMRAYAGNTQAAVDWINTHPEYASTFVGYMLGDEADMNRVSGTPEVAAASQPDAWQAAGDLIKAADPNRPRYANFGKGFALYPWVGFSHSGGSAGYLADIAQYVEPTTVISSDYYAITDPYQLLEEHGIWGYGRAIENTIALAGGRTVWGFLEASSPFPDGKVANNIAARMPASLIMPAVWNMIVHGAKGIVYFCHDFYDGPQGSADAGLAYDGPLAFPDMIAAMKAADQMVKKYAPILLSTEETALSVTIKSAVPVTALLKKYQGSVYLFVQGDGNTTYPNGKATDALIQINGINTEAGKVNLPEESTSLYMSKGTFSDHFEPYELHIYKI